MHELEMQVAEMAARERRTALLAGAGVTLVALTLIAFALLARPGASAGDERAVASVGQAAPAPIPVTPLTGAASGDRAPGSGAAGRSDGATGSSDGIDRLPMTAQSASVFMPLYQRAAETFGVNWRLIASIHQQETAFSSAPGTYRGLNFAGCCAGPMQFNVTNGRVSTWERFSDAFRRAERPARYPHPTRRHPSVYDDFDAIMAAGALLRANGAGAHLDGSAWLAAYHYYGHDFTGLQYADQVLARAVGWAQDGVCVQCPVDGQLTARFDAAFAGPYRAQLLAAERRERAKARAKARARARAKRERRERARKARERASRAAERKARARRQAAEDKAADEASKSAAAKSSDPPAHSATTTQGSAEKPATPPETAPAPTATTAPVAPAAVPPPAPAPAG